MKNKTNKKNNIDFPLVRNVQPKLLSDEIKSFTAEETREEMKKIFDEFEKLTGYKPIIVGNELPTKVLIPNENIKFKNK